MGRHRQTAALQTATQATECYQDLSVKEDDRTMI